MNDLEESVDRIATETIFSGVVRVDRGDATLLAKAYGRAHRGYGIDNTVDTRFGIASGTKGLTALTIVSLIEEGKLDLETPARSVLGDSLPLIADDVTIELLLSHRSGIGDYLDEEAADEWPEYPMLIPVQELVTTEQYLRVLGGFPTKFRADERFSYCNGGYLVLALIAERSSGTDFHELVDQRVCMPAGMRDTAFLRSDEAPDQAALGYLAVEGLRTNVFHLPVRGNGDGGVYTTVADLRSFWISFFGGGIVTPRWVARMVEPRSEVPSESMRYGRGFWLSETGAAVMLVGGDPGVSFRSLHDPSTQLTHTVISNAGEGAWPMSRHLDECLLS